MADPTADSGLPLGAEAGALRCTGAAGGAAAFGVCAAAWCFFFCWCTFFFTCFATAGVGAGAAALPLEFARLSTAWPAAPCSFSSWDVVLFTWWERLCWWLPPVLPGLGRASQYWSMAEVPGGAWHEPLAAMAGEAVAANAIRAPRKAIRGLWLNTCT